MAISGLQAREGVVGMLLLTDLDLVGGSQAEFLSLNLGLENTFGPEFFRQLQSVFYKLKKKIIADKSQFLLRL